MDDLKLIYFIEDIAHQRFIRAMVERIAHEESFPVDRLKHDFRYATGGHAKQQRIATGGFKAFLQDTQKLQLSDFMSFIIVFDGNCKGFAERKKGLEKLIHENHPFKNRTVYAIPDPHIERWYIMDPNAFRIATGITETPQLPRYKCQKSYYKKLVHQALRNGGINSQLGGAEYADGVVKHISSFYSLGKNDQSFADFIKELRAIFRQKTINPSSK